MIIKMNKESKQWDKKAAYSPAESQHSEKELILI